MSAFQKIPDHDPLFPFALTRSDVPMAKPQNALAKRKGEHFHHWHEILYVHGEGENGTFFIEQNFYDIRSNDIYIVPGGVIHRTTTSRHSPFHASIVQFDPALVQEISLGEPVSYLDIFRRTEQEGRYRIERSAHPVSRVEHLLEHMQQELRESALGYRYRLLAHLHLLLMELLSIYEQSASEPAAKPSKSHLWMKEILVYIDSRLDQDLSLPRLAEQALVSQAHFSRVFKQLTGFQVTEYLITKRLLRAKELLNRSEQTVALIAEQCGFPSVAHFHRMFRRQMGTTPGQYRESRMNADRTD